MKKKLCLLAVLISICFLCACKKCIETDTSVVEVTVKEECYIDDYTTFIPCGTVLVPIYHDARYEIAVEYAGVEYVIDDEDAYNKYKDKIGKVVKGTIETRTFDDGSVKYKILSLE